MAADYEKLGVFYLGREFDPGFLGQVLAASTAVQLAVGETRTLDVRVK